MADQKTPAPGTTKSGRKTPKKRPVFVVMQMIGDDGQPVKVAKENFKLIAVTRDAGMALDVMDSGNHAHAFYKKVDEVA